jgi:hypothetical protein
VLPVASLFSLCRLEPIAVWLIYNPCHNPTTWWLARTSRGWLPRPRNMPIARSPGESFLGRRLHFCGIQPRKRKIYRDTHKAERSIS